MGNYERRAFCTCCRKTTDYVLYKKKYETTIKDKEYSFNITAAKCKECGEEMSVPGIFDLNSNEIDKEYRAAEGLVKIEDINKLLRIYNIGKAPLSLALGFGEITITRYLEGQIPSKEYSNIIKKAISSPVYMDYLIEKNKDRIAETAYYKAHMSVSKIKELFCVTDKMLCVINYLFTTLEEVTPLMLQKLLYYTQGLSYALNNRNMFTEECEAWVHGPVYVKVYNLFKEFKYNPIDDDRFAILEYCENKMSVKEKEIVNLVINTFGMYGAKTLEKITHEETPWKNAREGYGDNIYSSEIITHESIKSYFDSINQKYDISTEKGLNKYINDMIYRVSVV